jgi:hypothetical protein
MFRAHFVAIHPHVLSPKEELSIYFNFIMFFKLYFFT